MDSLPSSLLTATFGLIVVLLSRKPVRRMFGAGPAFTLWLLPLLLSVLPWLPLPPAAHAPTTGMTVLPGTQAFIVHATTVVATTSRWLAWLWLCGCACLLARLLIHLHQLKHNGRPLPQTMALALRLDLHGLDMRRVHVHPAGPAVFWSLRCRLLLPADFLERFDADERTLVLLHETTHMRRGDPLWNLAAELALAVLWFHPLMWLALPRFRLDQELACDEAVLRRMPGNDAPYARTLLRSVGANMQPTLIPWFAEPQLKERLAMIHTNRRSNPRRGFGYIVLAALLTSAIFAAQAAMPRAASTDAAEQSHAVDLLHVGKDGVVRWNGQRLTEAELHAKLAAKGAERPQHPLTIHIDENTPYQTVLDVLGEAKSAGIANVGFAAPSDSSASAPGAAAQGNLPPTVVIGSRMRHPPAYPAGAIRNKEQGTAVLRVLVGPDGTPRQIKADPEGTTASQELVNAAIAAAKSWSFNPGLRDGKPLQGWTRISVKFSLRPL